MINYLDKIYVINLFEDIVRYEQFKTNIQNSLLYNLSERFDAVNGKYLDIRLIGDYIISNSARKHILSKKQKTYGISLTYGSLGCALSHYLIYKYISTQNKPTLIFEDDITLVENFDTKLLLLIDTIRNMSYDICYLGYNRIAGFYSRRINDVISKPSGLITGLYGYIVTPVGARKILQHVFPLDNQLDSSIGYNSNMNFLCATDQLVSINTHFESKTQKSASCENHCQKRNESDWHKLFEK